MNNWKRIQIIILIVALSLLAGCTSQSNIQTSDQNPNLPPSNVRDLHTVNFHLVDQNKTPIDHALVSAADNSSINPLKGYTDENGNLSFVMRGSIQYNITVSNLRDGQTRNTILFPTDTEYNCRSLLFQHQHPNRIQTLNLQKIFKI